MLNRARSVLAASLIEAGAAITATAAYVQDVMFLSAVRAERWLLRAARKIDVRDVCKSCGASFERCRLNSKMVCTGCQWAEDTTAREAADADPIAPEETKL